MRRIRRRRADARNSETGSTPESRREEQAAGPEPAPVPDPAQQIKDLHELREQGILTEEEFAAEKKKLLEP